MTVEQIETALAALRDAYARGEEAAVRRTLASHLPAIQRYLLSLELVGAPTGFTERYVGDAVRRFANTLELVPLPVPRRILELGANPYFFHALLRRLLPDAQLTGANFFDRDIFSPGEGSASHTLRSTLLREEHTFTYPLVNVEAAVRYPFAAGSFDLIFFCEILEHLVVDPLSVFRKIRRLLAPGGHVVITLPNALRLTNFAAFLEGRNVFDVYHTEIGVHGRHNREFTLAEMRAILPPCGFEIVHAATRDRFDYRHQGFPAVDYSGLGPVLRRRVDDVRRALQAAGGTLEDRGDNLYVVARRATPPAERTSRAAVGVPTAIDPGSSFADAAGVFAMLDVVEDRGDALRILGWAFAADEIGTADEWLRLVLRSPERAYVVTCERAVRPDVSERYGLEWHDPGFLVDLAKRALPPGTYRLGVLCGGGEIAPGFRDLGRTIELPS